MEPQDIILLLIALLIILLLTRTYFPGGDDTDSENMISLSYDIRSYENCSCDKNKLLHHVEHFNDVGFVPDFAWLSRYNLLPWWNSTRGTKNMSYDLRGDVPIIPYYVGPWYNSPLI